MGVKITGLKELEANIQQLVRQKIPTATAKAIKTVGKQAMRKATKSVAQQIGVPVKTVRGRAKMTKEPTKQSPKAIIRVNRTHMSLIRVLEGKRNRIVASSGVLRVGRHSVARGFKQTLKNGRTHIMFRQGKQRYGIDVAKVPLSTPLTQAFNQELSQYPEQMKQELINQLTFVFRRK